VDGFAVQPRPGTTLSEIVPHGFHVPVGETASDGLELRLPLVIRGSGSIRFLPLGETTRATLTSTWPHPSFIGDVLPVERAVGDGGFSAEWAIPLLNRSFPQAFTAGAAVAIDEIEAGVRLFEPVALYDLVTRAVKYGLLFVALTFLTLGLIELVTGLRLSLVQFLLIGFALPCSFSSWWRSPSTSASRPPTCWRPRPWLPSTPSTVRRSCAGGGHRCWSAASWPRSMACSTPSSRPRTSPCSGGTLLLLVALSVTMS